MTVQTLKIATLATVLIAVFSCGKDEGSPSEKTPPAWQGADGGCVQGILVNGLTGEMIPVAEEVTDLFQPARAPVHEQLPVG